ncbi:cation-translocating P-type ATPase [Mycobacterium montefiorense]|uniref:Haloacid dehalogenase n=1 Tax=Mycobacterium montefiorense TaxID=154654 RepID=A0AA37PRU1_9MYCO|nr:cation-translocating P-type ATPase [Mycobacterium montefiorense]GBG39673.1 haloacid dehalogenase [Mycobacterium montefiorense]GKU35544.1 haloacid dehalogenase [Mycobacterium montefiorense]GKU40549.1 haloacid dehalogenase [Mycobacterium montefiorense]GKU45052.1 haloacid dehalogenase [Mycobacterium montefiorense]GKU51202.1 haloacid dehalogenase [Mycobacterium montefiorense]
MRIEPIVSGLRMVVKGGAAAAAELLGGERPRRRWAGNGRGWIELRMPEGARSCEYATALAKTIGNTTGVARTQVNWPLSRLVVDIDADGPSVDDLALMVDAIECAVAQKSEPSDESGSRRPGQLPVIDIPGDGAEVVNRASLLGAKAVSLGVTVFLQVTRVPRLPRAFAAATIFAEAQPDVRRVFERSLGRARADALLALGTAITQSLGHTPSVIAADMLLRSLRLIEALSAVGAWKEHEPQLAVSAECEPHPQPSRPRPIPDTASENYARAATAAGLAGAIALAVSGGAALASEAVIVAAPRALNYARESFATTFCAGLSRNHHTLVMQPNAIRRLDGVDVLIVDPAVLIGDTLRVAEISGVDGELRTKVWQCAQTDVTDGLLGAGVHTGCALSPAHQLPELRDLEVVVARNADPYAEPLIAAARAADLRLLSVDRADAGHLRGTFDELLPVDDDVDLAIFAAVRQLQADGKIVAVVGRDLRNAFAAADLSLAVWVAGRAPAWTADILMPDLKVACRIIDAIPAAKSAARRGVELAAAGTVLGSLTLLPGVRAAGVRPSIAAAALALIPGYMIGRGVAMQPDPAAAANNEWHALDVDQAQEHIRLLFSDLASPAAVAAQARLPKTRMQALAANFADSSRDVVEAMWHEMQDPLTPILATGALASALIGSPIDGALVGIVLLGSAAISAAQRLSSDRQLAKMLNAQTPPARVSTGLGQFELVAAEHLTPGTIIEVRAGEVVPADARVLNAVAVEVDESSLTGESLPVTKNPAPTPGRPLAERACMLYEGSTVLSGVCGAVVVAVGDATAAGRAMALAPRRRDEVGLHAQLAAVTAKVLPWTLTGGVGVLATALLRGSGIKEAVTSGVYCAVAAVPEGLPLVATLAQREAARRLSERNVLVRAPRSVETLGRVEVVCFDKTGTLSENRLVVTDVSAQPGFDEDAILERAALATPVALTEHAPLQATDAAVVNRAGSQPRRDRELPFRAGRAYAAGLDGDTLAVKGGPEVVLSACVEGRDDDLREDLLAHVHDMATRGLRVIAVADRTLTEDELAVAQEKGLEPLCRSGLRLLGFLGITDTPRPGARELLVGLAKRDIGARVITGDHPATARAIAREIGLDVADDCIITGARWERLSIAERAEVVKDNVIYARMSPEQKVQIVQQISNSGVVTAMVGDGANDAAAIRAAAVGVGVSSHGSDPARGAADVVLTEGRVGSLLDAIEEGHRLWQQAQAAVAMLLGGNAGEVAFNMYGTMVRGVAPLTARQILLVNILTDVFPTTAVAVSAVRNMRPPSERGINMADLMQTVAIRGAATTVGASASWSLATFTRAAPQRAATVGLVGLVTTQLGQTLLESRDPLVIGTCAATFVTMGALITTPGLSQLVGCVPLGPLGWIEGVAPAVALTVLTAAKPDLLLRMASRIGKRVSKYGGEADRALAGIVGSLTAWAQELPGMDGGNGAKAVPAPQLELAPAG